MKLLIALFTFICITQSAMANIQYPTGYTQVPEEKQDSYKKAIHQQLTENQSLTSGCDQRWVYNTINYAADVLVGQNSMQPLLIFNTFYNIDNEIMHRLKITTDSTLKKVTRVDAEVFVKQEVNTGDLSNPVFEIEYVLQQKVACTAVPL